MSVLTALRATASDFRIIIGPAKLHGNAVTQVNSDVMRSALQRLVVKANS